MTATMAAIVVPHITTLSRGWSDWILFAEVQEQLQQRGSTDDTRDSIAWAVQHEREGYVRTGVILPDRVEFWSESGDALSLRIQAWLQDVPDEDSLGPVMNLFFEITEHTSAIIRKELQL